jgi:thiamine pyrophosphokinase
MPAQGGHVHAFVIAGGDAPTATELAVVDRSPDLVVAADSGVGHALDLGLVPDVVVGDFDSAEPEHVERAVAAGARVDRHPVDKDMTDLELALHTARQLGAASVTVLGAGGGRLDHLLANLLLVTHDEFASLAIDAIAGDAIVTVVRGTRTLRGAPGGIVTLLPIGGPATGVSTSGLRWHLTDDELVPASTRGVSNEIVASPATVTVTAGVVIAVQPIGAL